MSGYGDRVQETTTTTGTGPLTLAGATFGNQSFASKYPGTTTIVPYVVFDSAGHWETGVNLYTLSGTSLGRTAATVQDGSSGPGVLVSLTGTSTVMCDLPSAQIADVGFTLSVAACLVMQ